MNIEFTLKAEKKDNGVIESTYITKGDFHYYELIGLLELAIDHLKDEHKSEKNILQNTKEND
jgi:hypothetical protein